MDRWQGIWMNGRGYGVEGGEYGIEGREYGIDGGHLLLFIIFSHTDTAEPYHSQMQVKFTAS